MYVASSTKRLLVGIIKPVNFHFTGSGSGAVGRGTYYCACVPEPYQKRFVARRILCSITSRSCKRRKEGHNLQSHSEDLIKPATAFRYKLLIHIFDSCNPQERIYWCLLSCP